MLITIKRYSGAGNEFVWFDNRLELFSEIPLSLIKQLCCKVRGFGADGVLVLENSDLAPFKMRIFNADGSEAKMCGNGLRCFVQALQDLNYLEKVFDVEVSGQLYEVLKKDHSFLVVMKQPDMIDLFLNLGYKDELHVGHYIHVGVPHLVFFVEDVNRVDCPTVGAHFRDAPLFKEGTNVNFAERLGPSTYKVRTFERGVGETASCGTGAMAVALIAHLVDQAVSPVEVVPSSHQKLMNYFEKGPENFSYLAQMGEVDVKGSAEFNYVNT